ncbi:uncharacterized protein LOC121947571 [Plectropomus leopardus]|uniref:uncharacterized protein LOC121947571 n=1 Tax=Plectropomus leopardus TaxID=160734 RepID=UPI001C4BC288|nr:uncharacterized protein LOC121947571 [Plectropomus leopardus]
MKLPQSVLLLTEYWACKNMLRFSITFLLAATCLLVSPAVAKEMVITCNVDTVQRLSCDIGVISVLEALYGRADSEICSEGIPQEQLVDTNCAQEGTVNVLKKRCDGKRVCEVSKDIFGTTDPCEGTSKYLQTKYTCLPAIHQVTCEHSFAHLHCDVGQVITVYGADYGRRDQTTCTYKQPATRIQNTECSNPTSVVSDKCDGKNSCDIKASNSVFTDPCRGTYKYLEVAYICECKYPKGQLEISGSSSWSLSSFITVTPLERRHSSLHSSLHFCIAEWEPIVQDQAIVLYLRQRQILTRQKKHRLICSSIHQSRCSSGRSSNIMLHFTTALLLATTCLVMTTVVSTEKVVTCGNGGNVQRLSCDFGVIFVQEVLYGRADNETCSVGRPSRQLANTNCAQEGAVDVVKRRCDGKKECELNINTVRAISDPCRGIYKYLETTYTCFPAIHLSACEGSVAHLKCDVGQVIFVYGADYGRRDQTTCSYQRPSNQIENVTCSRPTDKVAESCNGRNSCTVNVLNSVFGDPCRGTYKYLEAAYICEYPVDNTSQTPVHESTEI